MITVYRGSCLELFDKDVKVLEMDFTADEFVWSFATNKSIVITKNSDECFYENLSWLMNNKYEFNTNLCFKDKSKKFDFELKNFFFQRLIKKKI